MARASGSGSITPIKSGFWVRIRVSGTRQSFGVHPTRAIAESVLNEALRQIAAAAPAPSDGNTLRSYGERFLARRKHVLELSSAGDDEKRWNKHVLSAHFIDWPLENVKRRDGKRFLDDLALKRVSPKANRGKGRLGRGTRQHILNLVSKCLSEAAEDGIIPVNPFAGLRLAKETRTHDPWTYLVPDEQDRISACDKIPEAHRLQIEILLGTGVRLGEFNNQKLVDVHAFDLHPHMMVRYGRPGKSTKGGRFRRVELFGIGLRAVRRWLEVLPEYCPRNTLGLAFPGPRGARRGRGKFLQTSVRRLVSGKKKSVKIHRFDEYMVTAGIIAERRHDGRHVRHHDLRHTCASSLVAGWWGRKWSLQEVCKLLGHSSISVTQKYAHLADFEQQNAARETAGRPIPGAPTLERQLRLVKA